MSSQESALGEPIAPAASPDPFVQDLALVLSGRMGVYLRLGPDGAVLSAKTSDEFLHGDSIDPSRWTRMKPEDRAKAVLGWIREAAERRRKAAVSPPIPHPSVA